MKKLWAQVLTSWQGSLLFALAAAIIVGALTYHLGRLMPGFHSDEVASYFHAPTFSSLLRQPINAPYYIVRNLVHKLGIHNVVLLTRGVSVLFGIWAIVSWFALMRRWYTPLVAGLASLSFALSHLVLRSSRLGMPMVTQLLPLVAFAIWLYALRARYQRSLLLLFFAACLSLLYVPGMIWLLALGVLWQRSAILRIARRQPWWLQSVVVVVGVICLLPLAYGLAHNRHLVWSWLDIAQPFTWHHILTAALHLPGIIALHSNAGPLITVGQAPLLDVVSVCLAVIGGYSCAINWGLERSKLTIGLLVLALLRAVVGGPDALVFLLIPLYLLCAEGLGYMLALWLAVFPRNPLAKGTAITLLCLAIGCVAYYHVSNYFVAWPQAFTTKAVFSQHL